MMGIPPRLLALTLLGMLLTPTIALAQIYRWVDEQGSVHYSEGLASVPSQYRARAKPIGLPKSPPPAPETPAGEKPPAAPEKKVEGSGEPSQKPAEDETKK